MCTATSQYFKPNKGIYKLNRLAQGHTDEGTKSESYTVLNVDKQDNSNIKKARISQSTLYVMNHVIKGQEL
jgi:hypothetical protein